MASAAATPGYRDIVLKARRTAVRRLPEHMMAQGVRSITAAGGLVPASASRTIERNGQALFTSIVSAAVARKLRRPPGDISGTRVWVQVLDDDAHLQPWEILCDPTSGRGSFLACDLQTPVIRKLKLPAEPFRLAPIDGPLRILGVAASPRGREALNVRHEKKTLNEALAAHQTLKLIEMEWITGKDTVGQLARAWKRGTWHVVHFIGHGDYDPEQDTGVLAFEGPDGGDHLVPAGNLRGLLGNRGIRLVVLNTCKGAFAGNGGVFSSTAGIVAQKVPAVVAMQTKITDQSALVFAQTFYEWLVRGASIDRAVTETRIRLQNLPPNGYIEWVAPVLYLSTTDDILNLQTVKGPSKNEVEPRSGRRKMKRVRRVATRRTKGRLLAIPLTSPDKEPPAADDPQKHRWGGAPEANGRRLSAQVKAIAGDWYRITLTVKALPRAPMLKGAVRFHLHDSFAEPVQRVVVRRGVATLSIVAYGAFTVGAEADEGKTRLELDLSDLSRAPKAFRNN